MFKILKQERTAEFQIANVFMPSLFGIGGSSGGQGPSGSMNSAQLEMAVAELVSHTTKRYTAPILIFFCCRMTG